MCLITFAYQTHKKFPLIIVANRDEFYERPTAAADFWGDFPSILAGRDLLMRGSWLGITTTGRFAAITNFRDPSRSETGQISRGAIVNSFLTSEQSSAQFIEQLRNNKDLYAGFNVLLYDGDSLHHYNNIFDEHTIVPAGVHSLSNASFNTPWPKAKFAQQALQHSIEQEALQTNELISILANEAIATDEQLPNTGVGIYLERALSAAFVKLSNYGTRCSTAVTFSEEGTIHFLERTYEQGTMAFDKTFVINPS